MGVDAAAGGWFGGGIMSDAMPPLVRHRCLSDLAATDAAPHLRGNRFSLPHLVRGSNTV